MWFCVLNTTCNHYPACSLKFLQIATLAYLCSLLFIMVSCHSLPLEFGKDVSKLLTEPREIRRSYKLYSFCSGEHMQITDKTVNAKASPEGIYANTSFISANTRHHPNSINILGTNSQKYLCFNKKGRLIVRKNGRKKLCLFKEGFSHDHYTVIHSVFNPSWYVGFNSRGKPMKGGLHNKSKLQHCYNFIKREHIYHKPEQQRHPTWEFDPHKVVKDLMSGQKSRKKASSRRVPPPFR